MTTQGSRPLTRIPSGLLAIALCLGTMAGSPAVAVAEVPESARVTTIVGMLRFVEWPALAAGTGITIAVVDNTALGAALRAAYAQQPGVRTITVVDVPSASALAHVDASVVVLGAGTAAIARQLADQGVVTVGDGNCPDQPGLVLNLVADGPRFRFTVNPAEAARAGVNISARLLRHAQIVN